MSYYIDKDLKSGKTYIASTIKSSVGPYVIECEKAYQADGLLKKLTAGLVLGPSQDPKSYESLDDLVNALGNVKVFRFKGKL